MSLVQKLKRDRNSILPILQNLYLSEVLCYYDPQGGLVDPSRRRTSENALGIKLRRGLYEIAQLRWIIASDAGGNRMRPTTHGPVAHLITSTLGPHCILLSVGQKEQNHTKKTVYWMHWNVPKNSNNNSLEWMTREWEYAFTANTWPDVPMC